MAEIIDMPKLSDTMTVGTLVKWLKKEGDPVKAGDMLAEVETDKATMELESFFDGTLIKIFAPAGSEVAIGAALCAVGQPGETVEAPASPAAKAGSGAAPTPPQTPPVSAPSPVTAPASAPVTPLPSAAPVAPTPAPIAAVAGVATSAIASAATSAKASAAEPGPVLAKPAASVPSSAPAAKPPAAPSSPPVPAAVGASSLATASPSEERLRISPLARKIAADQKIDPARLTGSGPHGRVVKADVLAAAANPALLKAAALAAPQSQISNFRSQIGAAGPIQEDRTVPASNMRAIIARRLLEAKTQIPHFYLEIEIDADPLLSIRAQLNTGLEKEGVKLSVNDFILKASAEALRRVPGVNASWVGTGIQYHGAAHVSFAVAIEDGLITPVIRDAHQKSIFAISAEAKPLGQRAKDKKLKPEEFTGGTFCVSNLGMMGVERFSAIINPPNAAILAVGTTVTKPVVKNGQVAVGQTMVLTLSCDHRVVDGALGAQFLGALKQLLESPALLLI